MLKLNITSNHLLKRIFPTVCDDNACLTVLLVFRSNCHQHDFLMFVLVASNKSSTLSVVYHKHEQEKRHAFMKRVWEVEHDCFMLWFSQHKLEWRKLPLLYTNV